MKNKIISILFCLILFAFFNVCISNAAMYEPGKDNNSFEGYVYEDLNKNGLYDENENLLEGIKVKLLLNNAVIETINTNRKGYYRFEQKPPGNYNIEFEYGTEEQLKKEMNLEINTYNKSDIFNRFYNGQDYRSTQSKNIIREELPIHLIFILDISGSMAPSESIDMNTFPAMECKCRESGPNGLGLDSCCLAGAGSSAGRINQVLPSAQGMLEQLRNMNIIQKYTLITFNDDVASYNIYGENLPETITCYGNTNTPLALNTLQGMVTSDYKTIAVMFTDGLPCSPVKEIIWDDEDNVHIIEENPKINQQTLNLLLQLKEDTRVDLTTAIAIMPEREFFCIEVHKSSYWEAYGTADNVIAAINREYTSQSVVIGEVFGTHENPNADRLYIIEDNYISKLFATEIIADTVDSFISIEPQSSYAKDDMFTRVNLFTKTFNIDNAKAETLAGIRGLDNFVQYSKMLAKTDNIKLIGRSTHLRELNLGLEERPKVDFSINEKIKGIKITLSDGTVLIDTSENLTNNLFNWNSNQLGPIHAYMDKEIMQGATITITYDIIIKNNSEYDTLSKYFGNDESEMKTSAIKVYSYVSPNMIFRAEENDELWEIETNYSNLNQSVIDEIKNNNLTVIKTTNQISSIGLTSGQEMSFPLVLSKTISAESTTENLIYKNYVEIVARGNTLGRRSYTQIPGNFAPLTEINLETDSDISDSVTILPPFGEDRNNALKYIVVTTLLIIISVFLSRILLTFHKKKDKIYK